MNIDTQKHSRGAPGANLMFRDWKWQQRSALRSADDLRRAFPGLGEETLDVIRENQDRLRIQITPYALTLIQRTADGASPAPNDPMWRQLVPLARPGEESAHGYDGETENWELPSEMVTPIAQRKYDNRVIVRLSNVCHAYCQFCYEALRTLEKESDKPAFQHEHWAATIDYLRRTPEIEEVILSGGEPLMLTDERIEAVLGDLARIDRPLAVRIHTRALTFNPFRITEGLTAILERYRPAAIGLHLTHPNELTSELQLGVERLRAASPILFANIPLLRGVNDDAPTMRRLCMSLYRMGVIPHYLYHFMPYSPGSATFRTPVRAGIDLVRSLKRRISNLAVPEYVLPHRSGKFSIPLILDGEAAPEWTTDEDGVPVVRYVDWRGERVAYSDASRSG